MAEALAARHALNVAFQAGLRHVILESDGIKLIHHLKKNMIEATKFGCIVKDILYLATKFQYISYSHVKRSGNIVAHSLAKLSSFFDGMMVWMEDVPSQIQAAVNTDLIVLNE